MQGSVISAFILDVSPGSGQGAVTEYGHIWSQSPRTWQDSILSQKNSKEITQGGFTEHINCTNFPHAAPSTCLIFSVSNPTYCLHLFHFPTLTPLSQIPQRSLSGIKPPAFFYALLFSKTLKFCC